MGSEIRLFKIASDINIGKETIVEYLQSKGFDIENKPTTKLNNAMVDVVYDKFKKEKRAAEVQRTKIQKHKDIKHPEVDNSEQNQVNYRDDRTTNNSNNHSHSTAPTSTPAFNYEVKVAEPIKKSIRPEIDSKLNLDVEQVTVPPFVEKVKTVKVTDTISTEETKTEAVVKKTKPKATKKETIETEVIEPKVGEKIDLNQFKKHNAIPLQREFRAKDEVRPPREDRNRNAGANPQQGQRREKTDNRPPRQVNDIRFSKDTRPKPEYKVRDDDNRGNENRGNERPNGIVRETDNRNRDFNSPRPPQYTSTKNTNADGTKKPFEARTNDGRTNDRPYNNNRPNDRPYNNNRPNDGKTNDRPNNNNRPNDGRTNDRPYNNNRPNDGRTQNPNRPYNNNRPNDGRSNDRPIDPNDKNNANDPAYKRKRKNILEVRPGEKPSLKGLTIVGKINVNPDNQNRTGRFDDRRGPAKTPKEIADDLKKRNKVGPPTSGGNAEKAGSALDKKKKRKRSIREQISVEDIDKAIKETLAGMDDSVGGSFKAKLKQKKRQVREVKEQKILEEKEREESTLQLSEFVTTSDLAGLMNINASEIILKCLQLGLMVTINQRLDKDTIILIASDYDFEVEFLDERALQFIEEDDDDDEVKTPRSPIVTIMGHVDHGKTSLLDFIRKTKVVSGESGGITQHIGAYKVNLGEKAITFLDTPGHEAFTAMRARGAQVTDIVVLVVAADDSVMPQTIEAISHSKAAGVPIIVAINKIDKPDAKPERVKQQLTDYDVLVEEWGGKNQSVEISAKFGNNVEKLLESILVEAELLELKANSNRMARGTVIESHMDKGLGTVTTIIVQKGTLNVGEAFVAGASAGRVRAMFDETGTKVESAGPSTPVRVIGFDAQPSAGDSFVVVRNDAEARLIANERKILKREQELRQVRHITLDQISEQIKIGGVKDLFLIVKGDVSGSVEALADSLIKLSHEEVRINILHKGVGAITESDVMLARASGAIIVGFHISPTPKAKRLAADEEVEIREYEIIYDCINDIQLALEGMLRPEISEVITGTVEIRAVFKISKSGNIAGCYVLSGKIHRNDKIKILRDGLPIHTGGIKSLKREKDDVKDVGERFECGIMIEGFNDIEVGDIIECYKTVETKRTIKK